MSAWRVDLPPYPSPPLSLNHRMHHMAVHRLTKQLRADAHQLAIHAHLPKGLARVEVVLHWRPPDGRARDEDNMTLTLKPLVDGLVDYGLVADDDSAHLSGRCTIEAPGRPPATWLTIHDRSRSTSARR